MVVLFQQPELHLHPIAQAALGSFFFSAAKLGLRGVLETHSSFFIDRFRADLRDCNSSVDCKFNFADAIILFCENTPDGNLVHKISIDSHGALCEEPDSYHEFFVDEMLRTTM
jgi:predicted ATPase